MNFSMLASSVLPSLDDMREAIEKALAFVESEDSITRCCVLFRILSRLW